MVQKNDTMLKVSRLLATGLEILVANAKFSVALATSWSQFRTLFWLKQCPKYGCEPSITVMPIEHHNESIEWTVVGRAILVVCLSSAVRQGSPPPRHLSWTVKINGKSKRYSRLKPRLYEICGKKFWKPRCPSSLKLGLRVAGFLLKVIKEPKK